jgi:hypothetical protein
MRRSKQEQGMLPPDPVVVFLRAFERWLEYTGGHHPAPMSLSPTQRAQWDRLRRMMIKAWRAIP